MTPITIRRANQQDIEQIIQNNLSMALETENKRLDPDTLRFGVKKLLDNQSNGFYLVAEQDGVMLGQLMVTYEWSDWRNAYFWWIQSVFVSSKARRKGIFRHLYEHLIELAKADGGVCGLRLYTEHNNQVAQSVYENLGMQPAKYCMYETKLDIRND